MKVNVNFRTLAQGSGTVPVRGSLFPQKSCDTLTPKREGIALSGGMMGNAKPIKPETMKKILAELEKGKKPLADMLRTLDASDVSAEKLEKASQ
jgi:hypothetical protein